MAHDWDGIERRSTTRRDVAARRDQAYQALETAARQKALSDEIAARARRRREENHFGADLSKAFGMWREGEP